MKLEKVIDEIIYNLKPVYNELGLDRNEIDIELIDIDECDDNNTTLAWCNTTLLCNGVYSYEEISEYKMNYNSSIKFDIEYEKCIYISEKVLYDVADAIMDKIDIQYNDELYNYILVSVLEYSIVHELRHIYQFKSLKQISLQYVDIVGNEAYRSWGGIFDYEINSIFEKDAINYAQYKRHLTVLKNLEIKDILSNIIYGAELLNNMDDESEIIDGIEYSLDEIKKIYNPVQIKNVDNKVAKDLFSKIKNIIKRLSGDCEYPLYDTLKKFGIR